MSIESMGKNRFEKVTEVDRVKRPEPEEVIDNPEPYYVVRLSTSQEREDLTSFVDFLKDPKRGKRLDSDMLRAQAARFHPVVSYLGWLSGQQGISDTRRTEIIGMEMDITFEISQAEGRPVNLMGHIVDVEYNATERNIIGGLLGMIARGRERAHQMRFWGRRN